MNTNELHLENAMEMIASTPTAIRWTLEVGLWSILLAPILWMPSELSVSAAGIVAMAVAAVNCLALLITAYNQWTNSRKLLLWVSLGVCVTWAIELATRSDQQFIDSFLALTSGPILGTWLLIDRWIKPRLPVAKNELHLVDRTVELPTPQETIEIARHPSVTATNNLFQEQYDAEADELSFEESEHESSDVTQLITRSQTLNAETIAGWMRIQFAEDQREVTVHLSFCPPLSSSPDVEVHDLDGSGVEVKVAASFPFGARLSVRRPIGSPTGKPILAECSFRVGFTAVCAAVTKAA